MKLSIIIPVYNIESYIERCLKSVFTQGLDDSKFEVLIINDGSQDNSLKIIEQYAQTKHNVSIYSQENKGLASARNKGMELANGNYIYFLDGDDYLTSNGLQKVLSYVEQYNLDVLGFDTIKTSRDNDTLPKYTSMILTPEDVMDGPSFISKYNHRNEAWWYLIKKSYVLDLNLSFPIGKTLEDAIFTLHLLLNAKKIAFVPLDIHRYYDRPTSIMNTTENSTYNKVISDFERVILNHEKIIEEIAKSDIQKKIKIKCIKRVKSRQQSFTFFMMIRVLKSEMPFSNLKQILTRVKAVNAYPIKALTEAPYKSLKYQLLITILNSKILLRPTFIVFRIIRIFK